MGKFVTCLINGNTGVVDDWEAIFNEYLTLSGDTQISQVLELMKSIAMIENKLFLIQTCVDQLASKHNVGLAEQLSSFGFQFSYEDGEDLMKELELTITKSKGLLIQLNQEKAELQALKKDDKPATAQDYEKQYSAISEFLGVYINPDNYSVSRYCADVSRMRERYQSQIKYN